MTETEAKDIMTSLFAELTKENDVLTDDERMAFNMAIKALEQEPKTGHWSHDGSHWKNRFICSECGYKLFDEQTNYCPNCGCAMVEPQESEDKE